ncbi:unnamed protein product [Calicophoron daubneyi]|uniref:Uncharacterized protein n=1 Tax=Calicophoron daubneyi TaxID=300641 RepID=A0AAV2TYE0_CALDB
MKLRDIMTEVGVHEKTEGRKHSLRKSVVGNFCVDTPHREAFWSTEVMVKPSAVRRLLLDEAGSSKPRIASRERSRRSPNLSDMYPSTYRISVISAVLTHFLHIRLMWIFG